MLLKSKYPLFGPLSFYKEVLALAIPVMLQQGIQSFVSLVDNFMVAGLGDAKMAGVNMANQVTFIYFVLMMALSISAGMYMSQFRGAGDEDGMKEAYKFKIILNSCLSIIYFVLCQTIPDVLISMMTHGNAAQAEIVFYGAKYLKVASLTFVPIGISQAVGSAFRETGQPKAPLLISVLATGINTFFNWLLIYGALGFPRLEVEGAAWATNIARVVECVVFISYADKIKAKFYVPLLKVLQLRIKLFKEILLKSGFVLISEITWVVSETVLVALYNGRGGAEVVAGMSAGWAIANIFFIVFSGINTATGVVIGGLLGANKLQKAKAEARFLTSGAAVLGIFAGLIQVASITIIPIVFANLSIEALSVTNGLVLVIAAYLPLWAILNAQFSIARSGGDTFMGIAVDVAITYLLLIPAAFIIARYTNVGPVAMYALLKTTDFIKILVAYIWLKKERWVKNIAEDYKET